MLKPLLSILALSALSFSANAYECGERRYCFDPALIEANNQVSVHPMRQWDCEACGASHDRDVNAAKNILTTGLRHGPPCAGTWQVEAACLEHAAAA